MVLLANILSWHGIGLLAIPAFPFWVLFGPVRAAQDAPRPKAGRAPVVQALVPTAPRLAPRHEAAVAPEKPAAGHGKSTLPAVIRHGDPHARIVMLTFDDGPHPHYTPRLLAVLRKYNVKATFFVVGKMAEKYPELIRAIAADGHLIANHTYDHSRMIRFSDHIDEVELRDCSQVIQSITGRRPLFFRPPGGRYDRRMVAVASGQGLRVVSYTVNTFDTIDMNPRTIAARVIRDVRGGGIVLCHDGFQRTIDALPHIIKGLQKKGYAFGTVAGGIGLR